MGEARPYVVASVAVSLDGCLDDTGPERLLLSSPEDFAEVDALRAEADAILVGAGTVRADDPRLLVRSPELRAARIARGCPESPARVVLTAAGALDPAATLFTTGPAERLVYAPDGVAGALRGRLGEAATVVGAGAPLTAAAVMTDLAGRGVRRLLVEGGATVLALFLAAGAVDELRLAVAPLFVGDPDAPRFLGPEGPAGGRWRLMETRAVGDTAVSRFLTPTARPPVDQLGANGTFAQ
jgi:5-amino-6-(5-phosphoribosylamino)uracil reductase